AARNDSRFALERRERVSSAAGVRESVPIRQRSSEPGQEVPDGHIAEGEIHFVRSIPVVPLKSRSATVPKWRAATAAAWSRATRRAYSKSIFAIIPLSSWFSRWQWNNTPFPRRPVASPRAGMQRTDRQSALLVLLALRKTLSESRRRGR